MAHLEPYSYVGAFAICVLLICLVWVYLGGQDVSQNSDTTPPTPSAPSRPLDQIDTPQSTSEEVRDDDLTELVDRVIMPKALPSRRYTISGTVVEATPDTSEEMLAKVASARSDEEIRQIIAGIHSKGPATDAAVTLSGGSFTADAVTDSEGRFQFILLDPGVYELSVKGAAPSFWAGKSGMAMAKARISVGGNKTSQHVTLERRADRATVSGQITDVAGRPIAGAKVNCMLGYDGNREQIGQIPEGEGTPESFSTVSDANGYYELSGLTPTALFNIAVHIHQGAPRALTYAEIEVEADSFGRRTVRVPLVTEELLESARRLLKAMSQNPQSMWRPYFDDRQVSILPSSQHNLITGIDIVLDPP